MAITKKYDLFIAYHGTNDPNGSYEMAKKICDYLSQDKFGFQIYLHGYSCLPEDKDIQWNRTWEIVDNCQCFLAVVNDHVARNSNGRLGNDVGERVSQIRSEVDAFFDLINRNMRDRNDFNFFYSGTDKAGEEQIDFFTLLHSQIINGHNELLCYNPGGGDDHFGLIEKWLEKRGCSARNEEKQLTKLRELLEGLGWGKSILFSPKELHTYEVKISPDLKSVLLVAANTTDDVKGGAIFPLVAENLAHGVKYQYLFFDFPGAKRQLESIYQSHVPSVLGNLTLRLVKSKAWIAADILLIKIYEFKDETKPEIFFRIKMSTEYRTEQCIYIKGDNNKIPIIQQEIDDLVEDQTVVTYNGNKWE
jgi:hypothetical protein